MTTLDFIKLARSASKKDKALMAIDLIGLYDFTDREQDRWTKMLVLFIANELTSLLKSKNCDVKGALHSRNQLMQDDVPKLVILCFFEIITTKLAKKILCLCWDEFIDVKKAIIDYDLLDDGLDDLVNEVLEQNQQIVKNYLNGVGTIAPLVGFCMKKTKGCADFNSVKQKLKDRLNNYVNR
jgi:Asp-tRNA(Asn)/Glu-tRNA(Gln) amidotransferase B subunit